MSDPVVVDPNPLTDTMTATQFRALFTAFNDPQVYVSGTIELYLDLASKMLLPYRWVDYRPLGMALFAAHYLILDQRDLVAVSRGQIPGLPTSGVATSKSVGGVSVSYDTQLGIEQGAGFWGLTTFGMRFYRLMKLVGMAGTQLGGPDIALNDSFGMAWPGVIYPRF